MSTWEVIPPEDEDFDDSPSKSQRKRDMHALRDLGETLTTLPAAKLLSLALPDNLQRAILEAQKITAHGAKRRQLQYIGKLMRVVDPAPIQAQLDIWNGDSQQHTAYLHELERWRERLLDDPDSLAELVDEWPQMDVQQLRTLIRNARKERELHKPPKAYRALFQLLKAQIPAPFDSPFVTPTA